MGCDGGIAGLGGISNGGLSLGSAGGSPTGRKSGVLSGSGTLTGGFITGEFGVGGSNGSFGWGAGGMAGSVC